MHRLPRHRGQARHGWHLALAFVLVAQSFIPLQAHTLLARGSSGQVVVVCTWRGARTERLPGTDQLPAATASQLSPACLFSQLLGAAVLPAVAGVRGMIVATVVTDAERPHAMPTAAPGVGKRIRAPPTGQSFG